MKYMVFLYRVFHYQIYALCIYLFLYYIKETFDYFQFQTAKKIFDKLTLVSIYILVGFIFVIFVDLGIYILCKAYNENCDSYATNYQFAYADDVWLASTATDDLECLAAIRSFGA